MKVSVIIPFHDGISFLEDCLLSLEEQEFDDMETILVCDHNQDNIDDLVLEYGRQINLSVYHLEDKTGVAAARNLGLQMAKGEYIYFLDSDDYLYVDTIAKLVAVTIDNNTDVVYGKKKITWFKRSVFISTFNTQQGNESEEEEAENSAFDNAQSNAENGGEEESSSSLDDTSLEESGEESSDSMTEEQEEEAAERLLIRQKNKAHRILITKRKGMRNISVLNILMKRSLIEENQIRFNENFRFYSDISFLVQVLEKAETYEKDMSALYIKRKHNDPVNFPALSQIKASDKFDEYIKSYYYSISLIPEDSYLRTRLDKKIINYYVKTFAPKIRRSNNDAWRTDRFDILRKIVLGMDKEIIHIQKGYRKKLLKALVKGDIKRSARLVNWDLGKKKLKRIIKNRRALAKFLYIRYFLNSKMKDNWVLCESFFGKSYSDSPKYIYEYLNKTYPGKYKYIWVINDKKTDIPYNPVRVKRYSIRYAYYLAKCKYDIFNVRPPQWVRKRKGNVFLETWHGTPLKKLVFDQEEVTAASPLYKQQFYKQSRDWDYLIAANYFSSEVFRRCFMYNNVMLETGYPRNDIMHYENRDEIAKGIRAKLGIPADKKTVLYAPTWRDDEFYGKGEYKFALQLDLHRMKQELGKEYVVLLRTHYYIADSLDVTGLEDFAYNLSKYNDISELYLISDVLITDYSSVFFDYANLKRPMLFFTYDLEKYRDVLRGFYIDMVKEVPGPLLFTSDEVIDAIKNIDQITEEYKERYEVFYEKFCGLEDGHASEKVAEAVFNPRA